MNKATFVSEIPDKIEGNEVPTLNLVKSMLTSENISDRIPEFNLRDVSGTEKYTVNGKDVSELSDVCYVGRGGPYMNANQSVLFKESVYTNHTVKLEYGGEVVSINSSNYESYTRGASVGNFQVAESKGEFVIGVDSNNNPTGIYKISVSFENGQKYEIEATVSGYKNKTTMNEDQVMCANAVRGYVEESVLLNLSTDNVHDRISTFTEGTYGYIVESPFVLVDNPGTSFLVDSDKVVGIDSSCFSGDVELKIEGFEYGGAVSKNPVKFECIIKGTSYSTNSSVLVGIENDPLPLLGLAKATKKVVGRIVAQKGNTSDFISRKFVIEKGPTDLNSDQLMTANAVMGYVDSIGLTPQGTGGGSSSFIEVRRNSSGYVLLCKAEIGQHYFGSFGSTPSMSGYVCDVNITVIYTQDQYSELLGSMHKNIYTQSAPITNIEIVHGTFEGQKYIALKVSSGSPEHSWFISTKICSDISVVKVVDTMENEKVISIEPYFVNAAGA